MKKSLRRVLPLFIAAMCLLGASAARGAVTPAFTDVAPGDSNVLFINYLSSRGIIGGFPDGTYRPGEGLTRAEAAAVLVKAAGLPASAGPSGFSDVAAGHWAAGAISAASSAGLLQGYPDGTFRPDAMVTRAEGITMFLGLSKQPDPGVALPRLEDVSGGHWAARPVAIGLASGMVGSGGKNFFPDSSLSRGDMARILGVLMTKDPDLSRTVLEVTFKTTGTAGVTRKGSGATEEIIPGASVRVFAGDIIKTGPGSTAELILPDGSGMLLEEGAELTIKEARGRSYITAAGKPGVAVDWLGLDMEKGSMFGTLAKNYHQSAAAGETGGDEAAALDIRDLPSVAGLSTWNVREMLLAVGEAGGEVPWWESSSQQAVRVQVDMPWGVAGVRGTTWRIALDDEGDASFSILEGEGELTAGGETQSIGERQVITVPYGAAPGQASAMSPEEIKAFVQEAVRQWLQERAEDMQANSQLYVQVDEAAPPSIVEIINQAIEEAVRESEPQPNNSSGSLDNGNDDDNDDVDNTPTAPDVIQYYSHENFLRGFAEAGNTVLIANGGGDTWSGSAGEDGYFAVEIEPQEPGDFLLVKSVDASGNTSTETEIGVEVMTYLTVANMECDLLYGVNLVTYLTDQDGGAVSAGEESVTFSVYDYSSGLNLIESLTPADGRVVVNNFTIDETTPYYYQLEMEAVYEGNGLFGSTYDSGCISAIYPMLSHLTARDTVVEVNSKAALVAFLSNGSQSNNVYPGGIVYFYVDEDRSGIFDGDEYVGQDTTDNVMGAAGVILEPEVFNLSPGAYRIFTIYNTDSEEKNYDISYLFVRDSLNPECQVVMGLEKGYYVSDNDSWDGIYADSIKCTSDPESYSEHPLVLQAKVDVPWGMEAVSNPLVKFFIDGQEVGSAVPDQAGRARCQLDQSTYESFNDLINEYGYSVNGKAVFTGTGITGDFSAEYILPLNLVYEYLY